VLAEFDHWFDVLSLEEPPEGRRIVALVGGEDAHPIDVSREKLLGDRRIVWPLCAGVHIEDGSRRAIHENGGFHGLERVIRPIGVLAAGANTVEAGGVDR